MRRGARGLPETKSHSSLQKGQKGPRELLTSQLHLNLNKVLEHLILEDISVHVDDKNVITSTQHGFTKGKSCLTNLIAFYDEMTTWMDEGRAVGVVCLSFSKALTLCLTTSSFTSSGSTDRMSGQWDGVRTGWGSGSVTPEGHDQCHRVQLEASHWWSPQGSRLAPVLFNLFLNNWGEGADASSACSLMTQTWDMTPVPQGGNNPWARHSATPLLLPHSPLCQPGGSHLLAQAMAWGHWGHWCWLGGAGQPGLAIGTLCLTLPGTVFVGGVAVVGQVGWGHRAQQLQQVQTVLWCHICPWGGDDRDKKKNYFNTSPPFLFTES